MTHMGRCITARGIKPIVTYRHAFKNTYLYGAFSPIDGDSIVYEIPCVSSEAFYKYILALSEHRPDEYKVLVIDNAGFHSLQKYSLPENICLIRIPPYSPELNPCEKMWAFIKQRFKNIAFGSIQQVRDWLAEFIRNSINQQIVMSITHDEKYIRNFKAHAQI